WRQHTSRRDPGRRRRCAPISGARSGRSHRPRWALWMGPTNASVLLALPTPSPLAFAGIAHHPELTRLLLARGADPNDGEPPYHAPETLDDRTLRALVDSGKMSADSLTTMLHRKLDWQHYEGVAWLLDHGADPNRISYWGRRALAHALERTSPLRFFK